MQLSKWETPIISVDCKEKGGVVKRNIYPMQVSLETLRIFWEKARQFKSIFNQDIRGDFSRFVQIFAGEDVNGNLVGNGLFWRVDDYVGIYYLTDINPGFEAYAHFSFFDRRLNGRLELTKAMITYAFAKYQFQRISIELPKYATDSPRNFIHSLGFTKEGRRRKAAWFNDEWYDVDIYGMTRQDLEFERRPKKNFCVVCGNHSSAPEVTEIGSAEN